MRPDGMGAKLIVTTQREKAAALQRRPENRHPLRRRTESRRESRLIAGRTPAIRRFYPKKLLVGPAPGLTDGRSSGGWTKPHPFCVNDRYIRESLNYDWREMNKDRLFGWLWGTIRRGPGTADAVNDRRTGRRPMTLAAANVWVFRPARPAGRRHCGRSSR